VARRVEVDIDGRTLSLVNLDKVFYPEVGFTKGQVIEYYSRIAPVLLPHLRGRPLTLKRYPDGVDAQYFYEKQCPSHRPEWVSTATIPTERRKIDYCLVEDLATLVWLANMADLELHTSLSTIADAGRPTVLAFDLDPGAPATIVQCAEVALHLRAAFDHLGLEAFPKTSGSKGMQIYVPLNTDGVTYEDTRAFSRALAQVLERQHRKLVVSTQKKELRRGKVLVDWSQNHPHKTTVSVYSLRAMSRPTASTPLDWDEVEGVASSGDPDDVAFTAYEVLERVEEHGDLFAGVVELSQELPALGGS
jgi:bifunctional non-homologous end joining protein LigD